MKHQWTTDRWMNEAHITCEHAYWNPRAAGTGPGFVLEAPGGALILDYGAGRDWQDKGQKGWSLQDDLTFNSFQ